MEYFPIAICNLEFWMMIFCNLIFDYTKLVKPLHPYTSI